MKKLSLLLTILSLAFTTSANAADVAWVKTNFWQSPYLKNIAVQAQTSSPALLKACQKLQTLVFDRDGKVRLTRAGQMETIRTLPLVGSDDFRFVAEFLTTLPVNGNVLSKSDEEILAQAVADSEMTNSLPGFKQKTKEVSLDYRSISSFKVSYSDQSFSKISSDLGLNLTAVGLIAKAEGVFLSVKGLDMACDILSGQIQLNTNGMVRIKISLDDQIKLINFYSDIEKAFQDTMKRSRSPRAKAASLGVRWGNLLATSSLSSENQVETDLENLIDALFVDDKLTQSPLWTQNGVKKVLSVDGTSNPVPVQILIK